jgi:hypothetical protein
MKRSESAFKRTAATAFATISLGGCGNNPVMSASKCSPKSPQSVISFGLSDISAPLPETSASKLSLQRLGGLLSVNNVSGQSEALQNSKEQRPTVISTAFDKIAFPSKGHCSASIEVHKKGDSYVIDAFMSATCYLQKALAWGQSTSLTFDVYLNGSETYTGYESLDVFDNDLNKRDIVLKALDGVPEVDHDARALFLDWGFSSERVPRLRNLAFDTGTPPNSSATFADLAMPLNDDLCLKVDSAEYSAFEANPNSIENPRDSLRPRPSDCQMLVEGQWWKFTVKPSTVASKKALLDVLVERTQQLNASSISDGASLSSARSLSDVVRKKSAEWYAQHRLMRRIRLAVFAVRANCSDTKQPLNKALCKNQSAYFDIIKTHIAPELAADMDALKAANFDSTLFTSGLAKKYTSELAKDKHLALEMLSAYRDLQRAMRGQKELVGIATNHVTNVGSNGAIVEFKDAPLFPSSGKRAESLARHTFTFDKPWLAMTFDASKAHPLLNNLRHPYQEGYAITFGGTPVGAVQALIDESGGASVVALPRRTTRADSSKTSATEASDGAPEKAKRETTTNTEGSGGC